MNGSIAPNQRQTQALARDAVDTVAAREIAAIARDAARRISLVVFRRDHRGTRLDASDMTRFGPDVVQGYETDAAMVLRMRDRQLHRHALYFGAESVSPGGIGSRSRGDRAQITDSLDVFLRAYRQALAGDAPPAVMARLALLAEADAQAEVAPAPVPTSAPEGRVV